MNSTLKTRAAIVVDFGTRGFGFVVDLETSQQLFFHMKDWQGIGVPRPGDAVRYLLTPSPKGNRASLVTPDPGGDK